MAALHHNTLCTQRTQGGNNTDAGSENTISKHASINNTNPTTTGWRRLLTSRPQSHSSGNIDAHSSRESEKIGQKQDYTFGETQWPMNNTTTTRADAKA